MLIEGLDVYAYHGVPESERQVGHRYRIDLEMVVDGPAVETDSIDDTVDYAAVSRQVADIAETAQFRTVERLADAIARMILGSHRRVRQVAIEVRKPLPPAPIPVEAVGCRLTVDRSQIEGPE